MIGIANTAPVPSPRRILSVRMGSSPKYSSKKRWPGSSEQCPANRYSLTSGSRAYARAAAAALAYALEPLVREYLFAGHCSEEPGHRFLLEYLGLEPILTLNMRLGEGTGAVLAMPIIESALRLYSDMATFASAGVSGASE